MAFIEGDLVILKSGGPVMTVKSAPPGGEVQTVWFSESTLAEGRFTSGILVLKASDSDKKKQESVRKNNDYGNHEKRDDQPRQENQDRPYRYVDDFDAY